MSSGNDLRSTWGLPQARQYRRRRSLQWARQREKALAGTLGLVMAVVAGLPMPASCADIFVAPLSWTIYVNGEIQPGDAMKFQRVVDSKLTEFRERTPNAQLIMIVRPTSLGGSVTEAMEMGVSEFLCARRGSVQPTNGSSTVSNG